MARKPKKKGTPYDTQIGAETSLRFNPEISSLRSSAQDVIHQRIAEIDAARSAAQGSIATSKAAIPQVQRVESDTRGLIDSALAGTPQASADVARTKSRLAERFGLAALEFANRQTDASTGFQAAVLQSNSRAGDNLSKIRTRLGEIGQEAGTFGQGRAAELAAADAKASADSINAGADRTAQLLAAGVDPKTGQILSGGVQDPAANGEDAAAQAKRDAARAKTLASGEAHDAARTEITRAERIAKQLRAAYEKKGLKGSALRQAIGDRMFKGLDDVSGEPIYETDSPGHQHRVLNPDGTQQTTKGTQGFKAFDDPRWVSIGLDLALDGGVSGYNVKRLHGGKHRYSVGELGLTTQTQRIRAGLIPPRSSAATDQLHNGPGR